MKQPKYLPTCWYARCRFFLDRPIDPCKVFSNLQHSKKSTPIHWFWCHCPTIVESPVTVRTALNQRQMAESRGYTYFLLLKIISSTAIIFIEIEEGNHFIFKISVLILKKRVSGINVDEMSIKIVILIRAVFYKNNQRRLNWSEELQGHIKLRSLSENELLISPFINSVKNLTPSVILWPCKVGRLMSRTPPL